MKLSVVHMAVQYAIATGAYTRDLPDGVWERGPGEYVARCISCARTYEIFCDPEDFDPQYSYCGGSDRCVP